MTVSHSMLVCHCDVTMTSVFFLLWCHYDPQFFLLWCHYDLSFSYCDVTMTLSFFTVMSLWPQFFLLWCHCDIFKFGVWCSLQISYFSPIHKKFSAIGYHSFTSVYYCENKKWRRPGNKAYILWPRNEANNCGLGMRQIIVAWEWGKYLRPGNEANTCGLGMRLILAVMESKDFGKNICGHLSMDAHTKRFLNALNL